MNKLIKNELTKILKKKSFIIITSIIIVFMIFFNILYLNYKNNLLKKLEDGKASIETLKTIEEENITEYQEEISEAKQYIDDYYLNEEYFDEQIKECQNTLNNRAILKDILVQYDIFIVIYIIMIAGTMISEEFNKGTIKLLLVKPYTRMQIFLAKFISCIIVLICMTIIIVLLQTLIGGLILGFNSLKDPVQILNQKSMEYENINVFKYIAMDFVARLPMYLIIISLAFSCSAVLLNTSLSIIIPITIYIFSETISEFATSFNLSWMKYLVTLNWNFEPFLFGGKPDMSGITLGFSAFICIIYFVVIMGAAIKSFKKCDIKNI